MLIFSTSSLFCQGDDFIRDGVRRLLGLDPTEGELWINRTGCRNGQLWQNLYNMPPPEVFVPQARAFVMAGTPGWLNGNVTWVQWVLDFGIPVWLIGIGSRQNHEWHLKELGRLIAVATVRDTGADQALTEYKVEHERFLDPGFHAPYLLPGPKDLDVVMTFRRRRACHEEWQPIRQEAYRALYQRYKSRIHCVLVHEPHEIAACERVLGVRPFFSHEPRRYAEIYCRARHYVGGRVHGAIPVLASGGTAHLLYDDAKTEALTAHDWLPVRVHRHPDWEAVDLEVDHDPAVLRDRIQADFAAHAAYLAGRIGR